MTAEAAVLNREAVALAADSAVSIGTGAHPKTFTSAAKIFGLSDRQPVGLMIYGQAAVSGIPWDTAIKEYRRQLGAASFPTVKEYADDLFSFLSDHRGLFPEAAQKESVGIVIGSFFEDLRRRVVRDARALHTSKGSISRADFRRITTAVVNEQHRRWKQATPLARAPKGLEDTLRRRYTRVFSDARRDVFKHIAVTPGTARKLNELSVWVLSREAEGTHNPFGTGVVVAGFGDDQFLPAVHEYWVEGVVGDWLKASLRRSTEIGEQWSSAIVPFAQGEMVYAFMEGIQPGYQRQVEAVIDVLVREWPGLVLTGLPRTTKATRDKILKAFDSAADPLVQLVLKRLEEHRRMEHWSPTLDVVEHLPKDELAAMAESLVNLTSFRRRVSFAAETVGGPIDVAVISKGDGFVWVKRKQYFKKDLNPHFYANRFKAR